MKRIFLALAAILWAGAVAAAVTQQTPIPPPWGVPVNNTPVITVTSSASTATLLPGSIVAYPAVTFYNSGANDAWCQLGGAGVTPVVATAPAVKIPANGGIFTVFTNGNDHYSCISSSTTSVTVYQSSGGSPLALLGGGTGGGGGSGITALSGDVLATGPGSVSATVANLSGVTNGSLANTGLANSTITVGALSPTALGGSITAANLTSQVNLYSSSLSGAVPSYGADGPTFFLSTTGWAVPSAGSAITALTGDVTASGPGSASASVSNLSHVTNGSLANSGLASANITLGTQAVSLGGTMTTANLTSQINQYSSSLSGAVPSYGGDSSSFFLSTTGWALPPTASFTGGAGISCTAGALDGSCPGSSTIFVTYGNKNYTTSTTLAGGDNSYIVLGNSSTAINLTVPSGQNTNWAVDIANENTGADTILAGTGALYPNTAMVLSRGEAASLAFDGTNFLALKTALPYNCATDGVPCLTSLGSVTGTASSSTFLRGDGSWASISASAGGSTTQVQYNNGGALGGISGATSNGTLLTMASGDLQLSGSSSGTGTLNAPAAASTYVWTLPAVTGTLAALNLAQSWSAAQTFAASDLILTGASGCVTATAGVLSGTGSACGSGGGGSPGGSNTQVQYNNSSAFGGISGVTSNGTLMTFANSDLQLTGSSTGVTTFTSQNAGASNFTSNFPAYTGYVIETTTASPATGDLPYWGGSNWTDLAVGTGSQCLLGGTTPTWGSCSTAGGVVPNYIASNWYATVPTTLTAGGAITTGTIYAYPFYLPVKLTISNVAMRATTAGSSNVQMAIYANNGSTNRPTGSAICSTSSQANTATTAPMTGACSTGSLSAGMYWFEFNAGDSTGVYASFLATNTSMSWLNGSATVGNVLSGTEQSLNFLQLTQTFGTWPNETSSSFTEGTVAKAPMGAFEVSSVP